MNGTAFVRALLAPDAPMPEGLVDPQGRPAPRRFDVYRNNVVLGLIRVLEAGFPATRKLVGDAFFAAMAGEFARAHPPQTRIMMLYGDDFADFIAGLPPAASLGYLPDVARLEQALRRSYHAADSAPIDAASLAALDDAALLAARFHLAPALEILRSDWPVLSIWAAQMQSGPAPQMRAEDVVILRPAFDPIPLPLPPHVYQVLHALRAGQPLGAAIGMASGPFDLTAMLKLLLSHGGITKVQTHAD